MKDLMDMKDKDIVGVQLLDIHMCIPPPSGNFECVNKMITENRYK